MQELKASKNARDKISTEKCRKRGCIRPMIKIFSAFKINKIKGVAKAASVFYT